MATLRAIAPGRAWDWRSSRFILAGGILAAAMIGGLVLGQALTGKSSGGSRGVNAAGRTLVVMPAETIAVGDPPPAPTEVPATGPLAVAPSSTALSMDDPPVATVTPAVISITGSCPPASAPRPVRAPRPVPAVPRAGLAMGTGGPSSTGMVGATPGRTKAKRGRDSLDDLIRKAAAGN